MGKRRTRGLFWAGVILMLPMLVATYMMLAVPGDPEAMGLLLWTGLPAVPGAFFLVWWAVLRSRPRLEEDEIEIGASGRPDLTQYDKPLSHYATMYEVWVESPTAGPSGKQLAHRRRTHALWGALAKGLDSVAFIAGLISGFAGSYLSLAGSQSFQMQMTAGKGFIGLAAMIFGAWHPIGAFLAALVFGFADSLQSLLSILGVDVAPQILASVPYVVTIIVVAGVVGRVRGPASAGQPYEQG